MIDVTSLLSLARFETERLESLWRDLTALPAKTRIQEDHFASEALRAALEPLLGQPAWLVASLLEAVLAERGTFEQVAVADPGEPAPPPSRVVEYHADRHYGTTSPELVWSGVTGGRSCARLTRYVIEDLFASTRHDVLIAGYSFDHATDLFMPLFERIEGLLERGEPAPAVRVILDCSRVRADPSDTPEDLAQRAATSFLRTCWPTPLVQPELLYYRPSTERKPNGFAPHSMHAKCIIVDREKALVGSANFSNRGRDRNLEVGALIRDHHFVQALDAAWEDARSELRAIPGSSFVAKPQDPILRKP